MRFQPRIHCKNVQCSPDEFEGSRGSVEGYGKRRGESKRKGWERWKGLAAKEK